MLEKTVYHKVKELLNEVLFLEFNLVKDFNTLETEKERLEFLKSFKEKIQTNAILIKGLTDEISANVTKGLRPFQTIYYLRDLETLFKKVTMACAHTESPKWLWDIKRRLVDVGDVSYDHTRNFGIKQYLVRLWPYFFKSHILISGPKPLTEKEEVSLNEVIELSRLVTNDFFSELNEIRMILNQYGVLTGLKKSNYPYIHEFDESEGLGKTDIDQSEFSEGTSLSIGFKEEDPDMNIKILIAYQSGLLTGNFHKLSPERQYSILAVLLNRSKANIKNSLTALYGDANTNKNPRNLPSVVEKTNELIVQKELGIPLIKNRKE